MWATLKQCFGFRSKQEVSRVEVEGGGVEEAALRLQALSWWPAILGHLQQSSARPPARHGPLLTDETTIHTYIQTV